MAKTAYQVIRAARFKIHDEAKTYFDDDAYILTILNDIIMEIHSTLMFVESSLVYDFKQIKTQSSVGEYALGVTHSGILRDGVYRVDYETPLALVSETDKRFYNATGSTRVYAIPEAYYLKPSNATMGFLYVPDGVYTFAVYYWKPSTELTETTSGSAEAMPFYGIFDRYISERLVVELLEIMERDNSRRAILADNEFNKAMSRVYSVGVRPKRSISDFFSAGGI